MTESPPSQTPPNVPKILYLNLYGLITDNSVKATINVCSTIQSQEMKPETIYFLLSSQGGFIDPGITLYNFLRSLPLELVMHNVGAVDSIANVIFLAGNKRYASPNSSFLFHGPTWTFPSSGINDVITTRPQLSEALSSLVNAEEIIRSIIAERTSVAAEQTISLFREGAKKTPAFALENGIIHKIVDLVLPKDAKVYTIPDK